LKKILWLILLMTFCQLKKKFSKTYSTEVENVYPPGPSHAGRRLNCHTHAPHTQAHAHAHARTHTHTHTHTHTQQCDFLDVETDILKKNQKYIFS